MTPLCVDHVVGRLQDLPSLPAVVLELLTSIDQEDVDISLLARKVSHDQALTAKTLRLANSSTCGLQVKVTTIQQAIAFLGFQATGDLITAVAFTSCFSAGQCAGFDDKAFWRHSIATAACARVRARHLRANQDYAFTAGLPHVIGRLVQISTYPQHYASVIAWRRAHHCDLIEAGGAVLGLDHVMAGVALAEHWNLSEAIWLEVAWHYAPEHAGAGFLATIVHVANAIVHALDMAGDVDDLVPPVSAVAWSALGLGGTAYLRVLRETALQFDEIYTVLMR